MPQLSEMSFSNSLLNLFAIFYVTVNVILFIYMSYLVDYEFFIYLLLKFHLCVSLSYMFIHILVQSFIRYYLVVLVISQ